LQREMGQCSSGEAGPRDEAPGGAQLAESKRCGRRLRNPNEPTFAAGDSRRREILRETLLKLAKKEERERLRDIALGNVKRWADEARRAGAPRTAKVEVLPGDWGEVALEMTRRHGKTFAVLNMANAKVAGGGYVDGKAAQEENMFRRTDCHFSVTERDFDQRTDRYHPELTELLNGAQGRVFLDMDQPRICIRGPEERDADDFGYKWLAEDEVFPFYELRAAAVDLRSLGGDFDPVECRSRIDAHLDTMIDAGVRHCVLSAFGCGAFRNPPVEVAACYRQALESRLDKFDCIVFAVFHPGYGTDNFGPFHKALSGLGPPVARAPPAPPQLPSGAMRGPYRPDVVGSPFGSASTRHADVFGTPMAAPDVCGTPLAGSPLSRSPCATPGGFFTPPASAAPSPVRSPVTVRRVAPPGFSPSGSPCHAPGASKSANTGGKEALGLCAEMRLAGC